MHKFELFNKVRIYFNVMKKYSLSEEKIVYVQFLRDTQKEQKGIYAEIKYSNFDL